MLKKISFTILFLLFLSTAALFWFIHRSAPVLNGQLVLKNLSAQVEVIRDQYGVPKIKAKNRIDAMRALGFTMAQDRLFQMEIYRRLGSGRLSEIFGEKTLEVDKLFRSLNLRNRMEDMMTSKLKSGTLNLKMWNEYLAFCDGINQFVETQPLPIEFSLLGFRPEKFSPIDGHAFLGYMAYSFGVGLKQDVLFSRLLKTVPAEMIESMRIQKTKPKSAVVLNQTFKSEQLIAMLDQFSPMDGSNAWIVSGEKALHKKPLFANDPHISYSQPGVWFEAIIETPEDKIYGHYLSLVPFPVLGQTTDHVWGLTMSMTDDMDLYKEKIDYQQGTYQFGNEVKTLKKRKEIIKIKGRDDYVFELLFTHHGPIMNEVLKEKDISLKWSFLSENNSPAEVVYGLALSHHIDEFKEVVSHGVAPGLSVMYADQSQMAQFYLGEMFKRPENVASDFVRDGSNSKSEDVAILPFSQFPHVINPTDGMIVSANSAPINEVSDFRGDFQPSDRADTIRAILSQKNDWTAEEFKQIQTTSMNFENKQLVQLYLSILEPSFENQNEWKNAIHELKSWDFHSTSDSRGAFLFYRLNQEVLKQLLTQLDPEDQKIFAGLPNAWIFLKRNLNDPHSLWWSGHYQEKIQEAFKLSAQKMGTWGSVHQLEFIHPIGRKWPLNYLFNLGPIQMDGAYNEINNMKYANMLDDFKITAGPSTRRIIDVANLGVAFSILPQGQSGHLGSPHYKDQLKSFALSEYREIHWLSDESFKNKLILTP